jgi:hypothetical protein
MRNSEPVFEVPVSRRRESQDGANVAVSAGEDRGYELRHGDQKIAISAT